MKTSLAGLEIYYIVNELQFLTGARIDKIYVPSKKEILLQFHLPGKGKQQLKIDEKSIFLTHYKSPAAEPSDFCMFLRKKLANAKLKKISQLGFERIVSLDFEVKQEAHSLIFELFSKGNIILVKNNKILSASEYQKWSSRTIRPNETYTPPTREYNILKLKKEEFNKAIKSSNKESLVKSLAIDLGLGGIYAEEVCIIAKINKNKKPKDLSEKEASSVFEALQKIIKMEPSPQTVYKGKDIIDITPFKLNYYKDLKNESSETYSTALDSYFSQFSIIAEKQKNQRHLDKLNEIIKGQKKHIVELEKDEIENKKKAEIFYQNYELISNLLKELKEVSKKHNWDEIKKKLKDHKLIKEVIPAEKSIVIEL